LVILVTNGIRSNAAAIFAGLGQTLLGGLALVYLPKVFGNFVAILFGLGAIAIVKFPEGILTAQTRRLQGVMAQIRESLPVLYSRLKIAGAAWLVVFVVLVLLVQHLWWLWLVVTLFVASVMVGYLGFQATRLPTAASVAVEETPRSGALEPVDVA
jgi:hypothetical protein